MTAEEWRTGRKSAKLTQVEAAKALGVSQPYLSQLEGGDRAGTQSLVTRAIELYKLPPTALPLPEPNRLRPLIEDHLYEELSALGYPPFEHVRTTRISNPAQILLNSVSTRDLDARLVEALPWVLSAYTNMNWNWLRDQVVLRNLQNRLGYLVYLSKEVANSGAVETLAVWEKELEESRLAKEGTLCRDSMTQREREFTRQYRREPARHWNLLTQMTPDQLRYAHE